MPAGAPPSRIDTANAFYYTSLQQPYACREFAALLCTSCRKPVGN